ncbi:hypothetical protein BT93_E2064 [Corymbia citriodora subsp. variegata]|nr:hypothetical protein BT93_E2064 [Corymbia citriodora subsp. variegata]
MGFEKKDLDVLLVPSGLLIMFGEQSNIGTCLGVISSNISAATFLASVSLTLCSLIGAWINNNNFFFESDLVYGDTRATTLSIKYISLLICFLLAFSCFIQSARHFVLANYLISTPSPSIPLKNVESLGLRALYFAFNLLLWLFGPIPMFVCSIFMVFFLYYLDSNTMPLIEHEFDGRQVARKVEQRVFEMAMAIFMPSHQN